MAAPDVARFESHLQGATPAGPTSLRCARPSRLLGQLPPESLSPSAVEELLTAFEGLAPGPRRRGTRLVRGAEPATAGRLDPQAVAGPQLAGRLRRQRLAVDQVSVPGRPSAPPSRPLGACRRRSVIRVNAIGSSASISRTIPSPPRHRPAPPLPRRTDSSRTRTGSRISAPHRGVEGVRHRHVDGARPVGVRPGALPAAQRLVVGPSAASLAAHAAPSVGCSSSLGPGPGPRQPRERASITRSATRLDVSTFPAATAAGGRALTRHPGGAITSIGSRPDGPRRPAVGGRLSPDRGDRARGVPAECPGAGSRRRRKRGDVELRGRPGARRAVGGHGSTRAGPGDDEQPHAGGRRVGRRQSRGGGMDVLRDARGDQEPSGRRRAERRARGDVEHAEHAGGGAGDRLPAASPGAARFAEGAAARGSAVAATASSGSSKRVRRCTSP